MIKSIRFGLAVAVLASASIASASAHAQVTFADLGKNLEYTQTSAAGAVAAVNGGDNAFFFGRVFYASGAFDGGSLSYNSTTLPFNGFAYDCCGSTGGQYQTGYMSKADMDAMFPTSTVYTLTATDSTSANPDNAVNVLLPDDLYADISTPTFNASSFTALNSLTAGQGVTIDTGVFTPDAGAGGQNFLSIFDLTGGSTVYSDFGDNTRSAWAVGSGIFQSGHQYEAQLIFDSFVSGADNGVPTTGRNDLRTDLFFTVGAPTPEPGVWALMILGLGLTGAMLRRRQAAAAV